MLTEENRSTRRITYPSTTSSPQISHRLARVRHLCRPYYPFHLPCITLRCWLICVRCFDLQLPHNEAALYISLILKLSCIKHLRKRLLPRVLNFPACSVWRSVFESVTKLNKLVACGIKMATLVLHAHHHFRKGYALITRTYPDVKALSRYVLGCRAC